LTGEVKHSAKAKLLSFNRIDVFLYDVMVLENDVLKRDCAAGVFAWVI